eukprot:TRINITY_DN3042_c0_g1_i4.p1 TRINITY_DN3042_c0_g1~~TRINITY_DN3042_c0_g1_i4.p1  ORF type:complete len:119 (-),score=4.83 TRINITY_DN3042_c0_g1_i4:73-429(-)
MMIMCNCAFLQMDGTLKVIWDSAFVAMLIRSSSCTASYEIGYADLVFFMCGIIWKILVWPRYVSFIELDFGLRLVRHLMNNFVAWLRYLLYCARLVCLTLLQRKTICSYAPREEPPES